LFPTDYTLIEEFLQPVVDYLTFDTEFLSDFCGGEKSLVSLLELLEDIFLGRSSVDWRN
jgi:hypothetical protein